MFVVLDGVDGVGKSLQTGKLYTRFRKDGFDVEKISFPCYDSLTGALITQYLFGKLEGLNVYQTSALYALDRSIAFSSRYKDVFSHKLVLCDRYTSSNIIHQAVLLPKSEWQSYINWLENFEFNQLKSPKPDLCLILTMPFEQTQKQLQGRKEAEDVIERDTDRSKRSEDIIAALPSSYEKIQCWNEQENRVLTAQEINDLLYAKIYDALTRG